MLKNSQAKLFFRNPQVWVGAVLATVMPIGAVAWKWSRTVPAVAPAEVTASNAAPVSELRTAPSAPATRAPAASFAGIQEWFEGSANPFLTTAQARDRRLKDSLAKVETALKHRNDVEDVIILVDESVDKKLKSSSKPGAVVSIRMRDGMLPVALADAAGSLVAAALMNINPEDVEVIDERSGTRVRAQSLDAGDALLAREALLAGAACEPPEFQPLTSVPAPGGTQRAAVDPATAEGGKRNAPAPPEVRGASMEQASSTWISWLLALGFVASIVFGILGWWKFKDDILRIASQKELPLAPAAARQMARPEVWSEPLACALHKSVAEKPALIAASLVERLESAPSSRQEVATLLLELEPWAAERILSVLPNRSLEQLENAITQPVTAVAPAHVRALAEAMISLRAAA